MLQQGIESLSVDNSILKMTNWQKNFLTIILHPINSKTPNKEILQNGFHALTLIIPNTLDETNLNQVLKTSDKETLSGKLYYSLQEAEASHLFFKELSPKGDFYYAVEIKKKISLITYKVKYITGTAESFYNVTLSPDYIPLGEQPYASLPSLNNTFIIIVTSSDYPVYFDSFSITLKSKIGDFPMGDGYLASFLSTSKNPQLMRITGFYIPKNTF